jgi:hypothetical protein
MTAKHVAVAIGSGIAAGWLLALALLYLWLAVIDHHELDCTLGRVVLGDL